MVGPHETPKENATQEEPKQTESKLGSLIEGYILVTLDPFVEALRVAGPLLLNLAPRLAGLVCIIKPNQRGKVAEAKYNKHIKAFCQWC